MDGPSGVLALVLAETAAGGSAVLWLTGLWGNVKRGFFILTGSIVFACALLAAVIVSTMAADARADLVGILLGASAGLIGLSFVALVFRWNAGGSIAGTLAVPVTLASLVAFARLGESALPVSLLQLLAGAAFMGAVVDGLLLGHWYLVDRRLPRDHIRRLTLLLIGTVVAEALAVSLSFFGPKGAPRGDFNPLLSISDLDTWLALGMVAATGLVAALIQASLRSDRARAVQAATGFFYLAVILAFTAETAAKIRFIG